MLDEAEAQLDQEPAQSEAEEPVLGEVRGGLGVQFGCAYGVELEMDVRKWHDKSTLRAAGVLRRGRGEGEGKRGEGRGSGVRGVELPLGEGVQMDPYLRHVLLALGHREAPVAVDQVVHPAVQFGQQFGREP